ncbi:hypothetical protein QJS66_15755 [Kocuria rhizophila]|nr:hypothetical protein QJS66_15755 [Kocuria rhizophila]
MLDGVDHGAPAGQVNIRPRGGCPTFPGGGGCCCAAGHQDPRSNGVEVASRSVGGAGHLQSSRGKTETVPGNGLHADSAELDDEESAGRRERSGAPPRSSAHRSWTRVARRRRRGPSCSGGLLPARYYPTPMGVKPVRTPWRRRVLHDMRETLPDTVLLAQSTAGPSVTKVLVVDNIKWTPGAPWPSCSSCCRRLRRRVPLRGHSCEKPRSEVRPDFSWKSKRTSRSSSEWWPAQETGAAQVPLIRTAGPG